ncbi:N-acetyltransferase [Ferrimonas sediminicola]|uniref:N-acetyltransferase n=1 Tax=Ferrimonas sediminicola TaxID=2569538 RepID=A0A4U1BDH1_9GAMM|nr:peptidogalycan biosysnthesis protein [Ferrimonas sediminicola]TKB48328.1 N-acetyltransferase [Ferrimonas sediminicola]
MARELGPFTLRWLDAIDSIEPPLWDRLFTDGQPFLRHGFLAALEASGSVGPASGWTPRHLLVETRRRVVAALPGYLKLHSYGEYVFDWSWARAYEAHGLNYYPKWMSAIPFTPVTGPRLGLAEGVDRQWLLMGLSDTLKAQGETLGLSGMQWLFPDRDLSDRLSRLGWRQRRDIQFHWHNRGYRSFNEFLARLTARKRRGILKERRGCQALVIERFEGEAITDELWRQFLACYRHTYAKRSGHIGYLNLAFFQQLSRRLPQAPLLVMAREADQAHWFAAALYLKEDNALYGRYWGSLRGHKGLHFELCYYQGIDYCIDHGLSRFEAGAQGEHKLARGFEPHWTYSNHLLYHPLFDQAVADAVNQEQRQLDRVMALYRQALPYKAR